MVDDSMALAHVGNGPVRAHDFGTAAISNLKFQIEAIRARKPTRCPRAGDGFSIG